MVSIGDCRLFCGEKYRYTMEMDTAIPQRVKREAIPTSPYFPSGKG